MEAWGLEPDGPSVREGTWGAASGQPGDTGSFALCSETWQGVKLPEGRVAARLLEPRLRCSQAGGQRGLWLGVRGRGLLCQCPSGQNCLWVVGASPGQITKVRVLVSPAVPAVATRECWGICRRLASVWVVTNNFCLIFKLRGVFYFGGKVYITAF